MALKIELWNRRRLANERTNDPVFLLLYPHDVRTEEQKALWAKRRDLLFANLPSQEGCAKCRRPVLVVTDFQIPCQMDRTAFLAAWCPYCSPSSTLYDAVVEQLQESIDRPLFQ
jgi:hypothetical protein